MECSFCKKEFISERFLQMHVNKCKWRKDSIRNLEMEIGVEVEGDISVHGCRFCGQGWINREEHYKTCPKRQEYKEELEQLSKEQKHDS